MYRKFAIGFFSAFVIVGGIYATDITHAEHSHTLHPMYNGIGLSALALFLAALMSYVLHVILDSRPDRPETPRSAKETVAAAAAVSVEDLDTAPTIRITPHAARTHVPAQRRPWPQLYSFDPEARAAQAKMTIKMVPAAVADENTAKAYSIGHANGYDEAIADMAGIKLAGDSRANGADTASQN